MTNRLDPYHTGPATDPAAEPTPTELLAWLRGREAVVDRRLEAHREGMLRALDVRLEPVTKQLSELQFQADATDRRLEEPDSVMVGPTGDGQSDLDMIKYFQLLREAYRTFMRYAADPTISRERFDLAVHEFREQVFELTSWMRNAVSNREVQGAQAT